MSSTIAPICIYSNESLYKEISWVAAGQPVDLTSGSFLMHIREAVDSADILLELSSSNGRIVVDPDPTTGKFILNLPASDVTSLGEGEYCYDLVFTTSGGIARRLFGGKIEVLRGTTQ